MPQRFIRIKQLTTTKKRVGMLRVSPATIWRWVKDGAFVPPYKLSPGVTVWDLDEIEAWLAARRDATV